MAQMRHPFDATPLIAKNVEAAIDSHGLIQLRKKPAPKPGPAARLARTLGFTRDTWVNLDEKGAFFWKEIDGKTSLAQIEEKQRRRFKLAEKESRDATILFTKMLMRRGLICLQVEKATRGAGESDS